MSALRAVYNVHVFDPLDRGNYGFVKGACNPSGDETFEDFVGFFLCGLHVMVVY
jgi:hypothetical protein